MKLASNQVVVLTGKISCDDATNFSLNNESITLNDLVNLVQKLELVELIKKLDKLCGQAGLNFAKFSVVKINEKFNIVIKDYRFIGDVEDREIRFEAFNNWIEILNFNLEANIPFFSKFDQFPSLLVDRFNSLTEDSVDELIRKVLCY